MMSMRMIVGLVVIVLTLLKFSSASFPQPNAYWVISALINSTSIVFDPLTTNVVVADALNSRAIVVSSSGMMIDQIATASPDRVATDPVSGIIYAYSRAWPVSQLLRTSRGHNGTTDSFGPVISGIEDMRVDAAGIVHILFRAAVTSAALVVTVSAQNETLTTTAYPSCQLPTRIAVGTPTAPYTLSDIYLLCNDGSSVYKFVNQSWTIASYAGFGVATHIHVNRFSREICLISKTSVITIINQSNPSRRTIPTRNVTVNGFTVDDRFPTNFTMFIVSQTMNNTLILSRYDQDGRIKLPSWTPLPQSAPPLDSPSKVSVDSVGTMFVSDKLKRVLRLSIQDGRQLGTILSTADGQPFGTILDVQTDYVFGNVYILDSYQRLIIADGSGAVRTVRNTTMLTTALSMTVCIPAMTSTAYVYILQNTPRYAILRYDDRSQRLIDVSPQVTFSGANIIRCDSAGNIYLLVRNSAIKYNPTFQQPYTSYNIPSNQVITDMTVSTNGNVFVLYGNGQSVAMFTTNGTLIGLLSTVGLLGSASISLNFLSTDPAGLWLFASDARTNRILMFSLPLNAPGPLLSSSSSSTQMTSVFSSSTAQQTSPSSTSTVLSRTSSSSSAISTLNCPQMPTIPPDDTYIAQLDLAATISDLMAKNPSGTFSMHFNRALGGVVGSLGYWIFVCVSANDSVVATVTTVQFLILTDSNTKSALDYASRIAAADYSFINAQLNNTVYTTMRPNSYSFRKFNNGITSCAGVVSCWWSTAAVVSALLVISIIGVILWRCVIARRKAASDAAKVGDIDLSNLAESSRYKYSPTIPMPRLSLLSSNTTRDNNYQRPLLDDDRPEGH